MCDYAMRTPYVSSKIYHARAEKNPALFVNSDYIQWASVTIKSDCALDLGHFLPSADWYFFIESSAESWARRTVNVGLWYALCKTLRVQPLYNTQHIAAKSSWIHVSEQTFNIKLSMSNSAKWERRVVARTDPAHMHMAHFGLREVNDAFSTTAFWHRALKVGTQLHVSYIGAAFDGYKLGAAQELVLEAGTCEICADAKVDCLLDGCGHKFCVRCLNQMFSINPGPTQPCPTCRARIGYKDWTSITKQKSALRDRVLSRQTHLQNCVKEIESDPRAQILVVCAEAQTMDICRTWVRGPDFVSLQTWDFDKARTYTHIVFTFSNFRIGTSRSPSLGAKALTLIQTHSAPNCDVVLLVETGEETEALAWQSATANLFANTTQTSTYAHDAMPSDD